MKRKLIKGAVLAVIIFAVTTVVLLIFPANKQNLDVSNISINNREKIELNFNGCHVKFIRWENESIKIRQSAFFRAGHGEETNITYENNIYDITSKSYEGDSLNSSIYTSKYQPQLWLSLMQFKKHFEYYNEIWDQEYVDYYIYIPEYLEIKVYSDGLIGATHNVEYIPTS